MVVLDVKEPGVESDQVQTRKPREDGLRTRKAILHQAVALATVEGLEGLSIGGLAQALGLSKSGLYAHFGSKQGLQLATIDEAERVFGVEVIEPASAVADEGRPQLVALCDLFFEHLRRRTFPGGCFFASAILEMGTRPGPVKERIGRFQQRLVALIFGFAQRAQELGQIPADEDLPLLVFDLNGIILAANANFVMTEDTTALDIARRAVRRRLSLEPDSPRSAT
jgi:AcrR family transcriptional regulator